MGSGSTEEQDGQREGQQEGRQEEGGTILDGGGIDTDERAGRSQGIDTTSEPDQETQQEMEEERQRRLDPDNRPEAAEVDNTQRDFDVDRGMFTDSEDYDDSEPAPYADEDSEDSEDPEDPED